jgi:hypothetical protein
MQAGHRPPPWIAVCMSCSYVIVSYLYISSCMFHPACHRLLDEFLARFSCFWPISLPSACYAGGMLSHGLPCLHPSRSFG